MGQGKDKKYHNHDIVPGGKKPTYHATPTLLPEFAFLAKAKEGCALLLAGYMIFKHLQAPWKKWKKGS